MIHDPFELFHDWLSEAAHHPGIIEPTAMTLATVSANGKPSARIVLLKDFDHSGFVFYTNTQSRKGEELTQNQNVALCFYWMPIRRQIRIEGVAALVPDAQADAYFKTRVREKQIGAWASIQSQPMPGPEALDARITKYEARFARLDVPRPPHWSGYLVTPHTIEFWHERPFRLHERTRYLREGEAWKMERLYP